MKRTFLMVAMLSMLGLDRSLAQTAAVPPLLNFQGRLARPDGTPVANGNYAVRFSLWNAASGGLEQWHQDSTVLALNGTFAVLLVQGAAFPAHLFDNDLWLEIRLGNDAPLAPRQPLVSVAYAMQANTVPDGSIGAAQIKDGSLTASKFAPNLLNATAWLLGGNSGVGTLSPLTKMEIDAGTKNGLRITNANSTPWALRINNETAPTETGMYVNASTGFFRITTHVAGFGGNIYYAELAHNGSWGQVSDRRMKTDILPLTGLFDKALALRPVSYYLLHQDRTRMPNREIGFIAQEVEALFPSLVSGQELKALNYSGLSVIAIGAMQELHTAVQTQHQKIKTLEGKNAALKAHQEALEARLAAIEKTLLAVRR